MMTTAEADRSWIFLDHTADIRMEVHGKTMEGLFSNAARGLTSLLASQCTGDADTEIAVNLKGGDYEEVLVDWLREILFQNQARDFVLLEPHITRLSETGIEARLNGRPVQPGDERPDREVKGVTYHGLSIEATDDGYRARIVFDI
ncbi:MAG: archease [Deltaproteobacteria bacterium]